jgi:hypothetical protein
MKIPHVPHYLVQRNGLLESFSPYNRISRVVGRFARLYKVDGSIRCRNETSHVVISLQTLVFGHSLLNYFSLALLQVYILKDSLPHGRIHVAIAVQNP